MFFSGKPFGQQTFAWPSIKRDFSAKKTRAIVYQPNVDSWPNDKVISGQISECCPNNFQQLWLPHLVRRQGLVDKLWLEQFGWQIPFSCCINLMSAGQVVFDKKTWTIQTITEVELLYFLLRNTIILTGSWSLIQAFESKCCCHEEEENSKKLKFEWKINVFLLESHLVNRHLVGPA